MTNPDKIVSEKEISFEDIAKCAQHFLAERPVVVLGSGATVPHGLPTMSELSARLFEAITENPPGWREFSASIKKTNDLEKTMSTISLPEATVELLVAATWKIISSKDLEFYEKLIKEHIEFPLANLFKYLLRTADSRIQVVTTNYDRLAEYAANYIGAYVSTGITTGWLQRFNPASVNAEQTPKLGYEGQVSLFKVHGSLDWFRDVNENIIGVPLAKEVPNNMHPMVVTPGTLKYREVHKDPFRTVMSASDSVLRKASCFVCIGYGFNDEHVQPILINRVKKDGIPIVLITKQLSESTRSSFLQDPPKKFIFFEETKGGTMVYIPEKPEGINLKGASLWKLEDFMKLITGGE
jgi:hypothetical protein